MEQNRLKFYRKEIEMTNGAKILITIATIITLIIVVRAKISNKKEENVVSNNNDGTMMYFEEFDRRDSENTK